MAVITDIGAQFMLSAVFRSTTRPSQIRLMLCSSAVPFIASSDGALLAAGGEEFLSRSDVATDETGKLTLVPISGPGYSEIIVDATTGVVSVVNGVVVITWPEVTFMFTGPLDKNGVVRGYQIGAVTTPDVIPPNPVLFEGALANPYTPPPSGGSVTIIPQVQFGNGTPT